MNRRVRRPVVLSLLLGCLALVLCVAPGVSQAGIVTWTFSGGDVEVLAGSTEDLNTFADPLVPTGPFTYTWSVDITQVYLQFGGFLWIGPPGASISESGEYVGSLPFEMFNDPVVYEENDLPIISANLAASVDAEGKGHFDVTSVVFGKYGTPPADVTGIRADGSITVEWAPVPEPSTALLFLGGIAPLGWMAYRRRRR